MSATDEQQYPTIVFTQEQADQFLPYQNFIDAEGIIQWGRHKGQVIGELKDVVYLQRLVAHYIGNAIMLSRRISGADPETLRNLIQANPQWEEKFRRYFADQYGITIPEDTPTEK